MWFCMHLQKQVFQNVVMRLCLWFDERRWTSGSSLLGVGGSFRCSLLCTNVGWIPRGFSFFSALWFCTHWSCYLFICHLLTLQERTLKIWSLMQHNRLRDGNKKGWLWVWLAFKCPRGAFIPSELPHSSSLWASLKHICTGWRPLRGILVFFKP